MAFLVTMRDTRLADGRDRVVRHGHGPERLVQTGIGLVEVRRGKLRDRGAEAEGGWIRFAPASCRDGRGGHKAWMHYW